MRNREAATADEIVAMGRIAAAAVEAGALGFTTSRTLNHRTSTGEPTPTLTAARDELVGIAKAIGETGKGVLQVVSDFIDFDDEIGTLRGDGRGVAPSAVDLAGARRRAARSHYRRILDAISESNADGLEVRAQVAARAIGILLGLQGSVNPLARSATYNALADLPLAERVARLRDPDVKAAILAEFPEHPMRTLRLDQVFELGEPPDYEPDPSTSVQARAAREGVDADELLYDLLLGDERHGAAVRADPQLRRRQPRRRRRDARPPAHGARSQRRRRARRHDLRRQLPHDAAHALGSRPHPRRALRGAVAR